MLLIQSQSVHTPFLLQPLRQDLLRDLEVVAEEKEYEQEIACPTLHTLHMDWGEDYGYLLGLALARAAAGHPITRLIIGRMDLRRKDWWTPFVDQYRLTEWDETLKLVREGNGVCDGLWEEWMEKLLAACLDESESGVSFWETWKWSIDGGGLL